MCACATLTRYSMRASTMASSAPPPTCWVAWRRAARTTAAGARFCTGVVRSRRTRRSLTLAEPEQFLYVIPAHDAAAGFEVADHGDEALRQWHREPERPRFGHRGAEQRADFGSSTPHRQITPDSGLRLGVRAVMAGDDRHRALPRGDIAARGRAVILRIVLVEGLEPNPGGIGHAHAFHHESDEHGPGLG